METVAEFYSGKSILVTGATGFIGKVLVEKLLRCCRVQRIYIMLRPKKGQGLKMRFNKFISSRVFDNIRQDRHIFDKLHVIRGDLLQDDLGISEQDRRLLEDECQVVFHSAAVVKFDTFIRDAVNMNVVGTQKVLQLAENMQKLQVFVHLSTSYCRSDIDCLEETLYPAKHNPHDVIHSTKWMDYDLLKTLEPKLISPQPNTYSYTKSLAEELVSEYKGKFPIVIARPSIVTAALREPFPGWVDNLNGPTGLIVGAAKGVVRSMLCDPSSPVDAMPVDLVVNGCILLAYTTALSRPSEVEVCNITRSDVNPITWEDSTEIGRQHVKDYPFSISLWHPNGTLTKSEFQHNLNVLFLHMLPAYIIDLVLILMGKKPFLVNVHKKINKGMRVIQNYSVRCWRFRNDKYLALRKSISEDEDAVFYTDPKAMDWSSYLKNYLKGAREFCCGETTESLPQAKRLYTRLFYLDLLVKMMLVLGACYLVYVNSVRVFSEP